MKIDYEGRVYEFDFARLTVGECEDIEKFTGVKGLGEWSLQLQLANTKALQAAWWAIRRQAGEDPGPIARRDPGFLPVALSEALAEAEKAEAEAAAAAAAQDDDAEPDPTRSARSSRTPAGTPTTPAPAAGPSLPG